VIYKKTTHSIEVSVEPTYLPDQSAPNMHRFVWAYEVTLVNRGIDSVRLRRRHWIITNAIGEVQEVEGVGVVGEQPLLEPGHSFSYRSGCPLTTPSGIMVGHYEMERADGTTFRIDVPAFSLDLPDDRPAMN